MLLESSGLLVPDLLWRTCIIPAKPGSNCPTYFRGEGQNICKVYVQTVEMLIDGKSSHGP
jgi:hypothetical protein